VARTARGGAGNGSVTDASWRNNALTREQPQGYN
jgi:hypothetical protein